MPDHTSSLPLKRELLLVLGVALFLSLVSIWLQVQVSPGPMTLGEDIWQKKLDLHLDAYPFKLRPFQSYATLFLHEQLGLSIRNSFFILQYTLALLIALAFYVLLRRLRFDRTWAMIGLILLLTAYPILGAHWAPTHTWDDFWGYLFITLSLLAVLRDRPLQAGLWLLLAAIARETNVIFVPLVLFPLWKPAEPKRRALILACGLAPLVVAGAIRLLWGADEDFSRWAWHLNYNFETALRVNDTIVSLIIAFGPLWVLSLIGFFQVKNDTTTPHRSLLLWGYAVSVPLHLAFGLAGGMARETRLLFPPFVFLIPLATLALRSLVARIKTGWTKKPKYLPLEALVVLCIVGVVAASEWLFPTFDYGTNAAIRRPLAGIYLGMIVWLGWVYLITRRREPTRQPGD